MSKKRSIIYGIGLFIITLLFNMPLPQPELEFDRSIPFEDGFEEFRIDVYIDPSDGSYVQRYYYQDLLVFDDGHRSKIYDASIEIYYESNNVTGYKIEDPTTLLLLHNHSEGVWEAARSSAIRRNPKNYRQFESSIMARVRNYDYLWTVHFAEYLLKIGNTEVISYLREYEQEEVDFVATGHEPTDLVSKRTIADRARNILDRYNIDY